MERNGTFMKVVNINWIDSQISQGWRPKDSSGPCHINTVGILVYEDKKDIVVSTSVSENDNFIDQLTIPKIAITKIKRLRI